MMNNKLEMYDIECYVILSFDGIERKYGCKSYFDAVVLDDALSKAYGSTSVSIWSINGQVK